MKLLSILFVLLLSGCVTTHWDGEFSGRSVEVTVMKGSLPVSGVVVKCFPVGNSPFVEDVLSKELNGSALPSNEKGILILEYSSVSIGGTFHSIGGYEWGRSQQPEVECKLEYRGAIVSSFNVLSIASAVTVSIK